MKFKFKKDSISKIFHVLKNGIRFELIQIIFYPLFHLYPVQHAKASKTKLKMIKKVVKLNNHSVLNLPCKEKINSIDLYENKKTD